MMNKPMFIAFLRTGTLKEWGAYNFPPLKRGFGGLKMGAKINRGLLVVKFFEKTIK